MPETAIAPFLNKIDLAKLQALKLEWGVSMQALFERAFQLGKVDDDERVKFYKAMNRRGWKVSEPVSDRLPQEVPQLMSHIEQMLESAGFTHEEYPNLIGVDITHPDSLLTPPQSGLHAVK